MKLDASAIATLGASLRPINPSLMKAGEEGDAKQRLWYQGCEPSWRPPNYLQTGETDEMDVPPEVAYYAASKTIRDGAAIDWLLVASIQAILAQRPEEPMLTQVSNLLANCLNEHPSHA